MRKVFWDDPYQQTLTTKVAALTGNQILLEDTIIFSFSGGKDFLKSLAVAPMLNPQPKSGLSL